MRHTLTLIPSGDSLCNNTDHEMLVDVEGGEKNMMIAPGEVFKPTRAVTLTFEVPDDCPVRVYVNKGYPNVAAVSH